MVPVLQKLEQTVQDNSSESSHKLLQDLLCGLLQVILIKVGHLVQPELSSQIITLLIQMFQKAGRVTENGLIAFQGMSYGLGEKIDLSEIGRYLKAALQSQEDDCAKSACGIISDLSNSKGEGLNEYLEDFVPCLHDIL
jgi:hypothetical protein